jgi:succinate dehydrogenase / fumarate reductase cytochrome b subunit
LQQRLNWHLQDRREQNKKSCVGKTVKKQRPVNLDLSTIRFPVTAVSSILHRVSGVITFVAVGILLWLLGLSLSSPEGFLQASAVMDSFFVKFIMWGILTALAYHAASGIRHMLMDFGYLAETMAVGRRSAYFAMGLTVVLSILAGVFVW